MEQLLGHTDQHVQGLEVGRSGCAERDQITQGLEHSAGESGFYSGGPLEAKEEF